MSKLTMDRVRGLGLFAECRRAQLRAIDRLGCTFDLGPDTVLCREGEPGREFFVLAAGTVTMSTSKGTVAALHSGAWFGEIALMRDIPRQATVTTSSEATVLVFNPREFAMLLAIAPCVRQRLEGSVNLVGMTDRPTIGSWYQPLSARPVDPSTATPKDLVRT